MTTITSIEKKINYHFHNQELLTLALTHKSCSVQKNNQRLEFLGDSILGAIIAEYLFNKFPSYSDGDLTKLKSTLVKKEALARLGHILKLEKYLNVSPNIKQITISMLEDTVESLIGAVYLDSSYEQTRTLVLSFFESHFMKEILSRDFLKENTSYTARLKEYSEKRYQSQPEVEMISKTGKDNSPTFIMEVRVKDLAKQGKGKSKKEAIANASKALLDILLKK